MKKRVFCGCLIVLLSLAVYVSNSFADESGANQCKYDPIRKLGRGMANITFGWLEIFIQPSLQNKPAEILLGAVRGVGYFLGRTAAGVYEVVTFPIPMPEKYKPVVKPELVFDTAVKDK